MRYIHTCNYAENYPMSYKCQHFQSSCSARYLVARITQYSQKCCTSCSTPRLYLNDKGQTITESESVLARQHSYRKRMSVTHVFQHVQHFLFIYESDITSVSYANTHCYPHYEMNSIGSRPTNYNQIQVVYTVVHMGSYEMNYMY